MSEDKVSLEEHALVDAVRLSTLKARLFSLRESLAESVGICKREDGPDYVDRRFETEGALAICNAVLAYCLGDPKELCLYTEELGDFIDEHSESQSESQEDKEEF